MRSHYLKVIFPSGLREIDSPRTVNGTNVSRMAVSAQSVHMCSLRTVLTFRRMQDKLRAWVDGQEGVMVEP